MVTVGNDELVQAIKSLQEKEALFGLKKITESLKGSHPEWSLGEKRGMYSF